MKKSHYDKELKQNAEGKHVIVLDLSRYAGGLYLVDFQSGSLNKTVKVERY